MIVDDFQKDQEAHEYQWGMTVEDDLVQDSATAATDAGGAFCDDVVLGEAKPSGAPRYLLVRLLNAAGRKEGESAAKLESYDLPNTPNPPIVMRRLSITTRAVAPEFKVLLFPYKKGQEQPTTTWDKERLSLRVDWSDQHDVAIFRKSEDGRTRVTLQREGKEIGGLD